MGTIFSVVGKFLGMNFSGEILHRGDLTEFVLLVLLSLCQLNFAFGDVLGELSGEIVQYV